MRCLTLLGLCLIGAGCTLTALETGMESKAQPSLSVAEIEQVLNSTDDFDALRTQLQLHTTTASKGSLVPEEVCSSRQFPDIEIRMQVDQSSGHRRVVHWDVVELKAAKKKDKK